jgi:hypothetical protein
MWEAFCVVGLDTDAGVTVRMLLLLAANGTSASCLTCDTATNSAHEELYWTCTPRERQY